MNKRFTEIVVAFIVSLLASVVLGCTSSSSQPESTSEPSLPPIYVSIVLHTEEPTRPQHLRFVADETVFHKFRNGLLDFTAMLKEEGVAFNFQSDWNFLLAASLYDNGTPSTQGKNIVRYLTEDLGFAADPHAHETDHNYADVAYLIEQLGVPASPIAGGFIAYPPEKSKLEYFTKPLTGNHYDFTWQAEVLWGGATSMHQNEEALWVSGIWNPKDNENFTVHSDDAPLPHIGGYKSDWSGLLDLLDHQQNAELEADKIYTQTIFIGQRDMLDKSFTENFRTQIQDLSGYTDADLVKWVTLAEVVRIWENEYQSIPNLYFWQEP